MTEHENEEMNDLIRGPDTPPEELLTAHERLAVEGLRAGVEPTLAGDLWRFVDLDLAPEAEIDAAAEVAELRRSRPQIFDDDETAFNRTLRGAGLPAYTSVPTNRSHGSANGGAMPMPESPKTMSDRIRETFRAHRSGGSASWAG